MTLETERPRMPLPEGYDPARTVVLSASQMSDFAGDPKYSCPRKWSFKKVFDLPEIEQQPQVFGKRTHECTERFGLADDLGRDPKTGAPVELYPAGWDRGLSPLEADTIQKLIADAIGAGFLSRKRGRLVEHGFIMPLVDYFDGDAGLIRLLVTGFIDLLNVEDGEVVDYKTTGNVKNLKSSAKLEQDRQMLLYAKVLLGMRPSLAAVRLRHVGFVSDPKDARVRDTPAVVSYKAVEAAWKEMQDLGQLMIETATRYTIDEWHEIPSTSSPDSACRRCSFQAICGGSLSPQEYKAIQLRRKSNVSNATTVPPAGKPAVNPPPKPAKKVVQVHYFSDQQEEPKLMDESDVAAIAVAKSQTGGHVCLEGSQEWTPLEKWFEGQPKPEAAKPTVQQPAMPWANADCKPCNGTGLDKAGKPHLLCNVKAPEDKRAKHYDLTTDGSGVVTATRKASDAPAAEVKATIPAAATETKVEAKPEALVKPDVAPEPVKQETPKEEGAAEPEKRGRGRPLSSFKLYVGIHPGRGCGSVVYLGDVVAKHKAAVAKVSGVPTFNGCKAFERDDCLIDSIVSKISEDLGTSDVLVPVVDFEMRKIINAIEPLASRTFYGGAA